MEINCKSLFNLSRKKTGGLGGGVVQIHCCFSKIQWKWNSMKLGGGKALLLGTKVMKAISSNHVWKQFSH